MVVIRNGHGHLAHENLKSAVFKEWVNEFWADFLHADCDCRIFKSTMSPEQINKSWSKSFCLGIVKNGCGQSGFWALKLIAYEKWTDGINWYRITKIKADQIFLGVGMVKNGCGQSVHKTLKLAVSQKWTEGI